MPYVPVPAWEIVFVKEVFQECVALACKECNKKKKKKKKKKKRTNDLPGAPPPQHPLRHRHPSTPPPPDPPSPHLAPSRLRVGFLFDYREVGVVRAVVGLRWGGSGCVCVAHAGVGVAAGCCGWWAACHDVVGDWESERVWGW